jgi:aminoglycoside phosphotransferase
VIAATRSLAPDPAVRHRDALLDAASLAPQLGAALGAEVDACALELAHYRVGSRLSTLYRVRAGGRAQRVSARTFASAQRAEEVARQSAPATCDAGLATVFWAYPHDRRIPALPALRDGRLVRYVPERAAIAAWDDAAGRPVGFAKAYGNASGGRAVRAQTALSRALGDDDPHLRVPRVLGWWPDLRLLASEALPGRALIDLDARELEGALARFGAALARLHGLRLPVALPYGGRLPVRIRRVVDAVVRVRPDQAPAARELYRALCQSRRPRYEGDLVTLHGDATVSNALLAEGRVSLIDLDGVALGPASVDFGRMLAWLATRRVLGRIDAAGHDRLRGAFLSGYASLRPLPPAAALRWHCAAATLEGRGRQAVSWLDAEAAEHLGVLLADARGLLA